MKCRRRSLRALLLAAAVVPWQGAAPAMARPPVVAATIFPAADIARRVAGPGIRIIQVLPPGASPHTFDLTPGQVRELQPARVLFKVGGIDDWIDGVAASLPGAALVPLDRGIALLPSREGRHGHGANGPHPGGGSDPHYWLSAANGALMARSIAEALKGIDPSRAAAYEANCRKFSREMQELHAALKAEMSHLRNNKMVVFHDAWRYFAAAYGLEVSAVFQASPGREPTPRELKGLYDVVRRHGIRAIFSEPQLPADSLEPLLRDLGLALVVLDPLGGAAAGDSYAGMLRRNARAIVEALGR